MLNPMEPKIIASLKFRHQRRLLSLNVDSSFSWFESQNVAKRPEIGGREIVDLMQIQYGIDITYSKAWRTIETARNTIFGSFGDSYSQLHWYCEAIRRTNPGSVVSLQYNIESFHFERLFVSFKACIDGFQFCRPMLFLDGTFMKGRAHGTLLVATAKDGDNGLFPIAFGVVSAENTDNWVWFLEKLRGAVSHKNQIFYLSDRNCGLMSAFNIVFKEPVHFFCLYHLLSNLKARFSSGWSNLKRAKMGEHFRECAYAPNRRLFDEKLAVFKEVGGSIAEQWLEDLPYEKWAAAYSPHIITYGEMTSNAAESFNSWILDARSKPIVQMIDHIRIGICRWFVERREDCNSWTGALVPHKEVLWNQLIDVSRGWFVSECPGGNYEVLSTPSVSVNLTARTCSCHQWQVLGFPCAHAVAVIKRHRSSIFSHVDECFFTTSYRKCYECDLYPIPQTEMYECQRGDHDIILPPILKRPPGRPKKSRNPSFGEWRKRKPFFCPRCKKVSKHDSLTCGLILDTSTKN